MAILKIKDETGKFVDIPAIQGAPGKDGAIQYTAGEGIKIDGNVISTINDGNGIIELTDEYVYMTELEAGVYLLNGTTRLYYGSSSTSWYGVGSTKIKNILIVVKAKSANGSILTNGVMFSETSIIYLRNIGYTIIAIDKILTTTNTTAYTPTNTYNPATKKYVDDSIAAAITTTLEGEY